MPIASVVSSSSRKRKKTDSWLKSLRRTFRFTTEIDKSAMTEFASFRAEIAFRQDRKTRKKINQTLFDNSKKEKTRFELSRE
jgi:hypothetical protein